MNAYFVANASVEVRDVYAKGVCGGPSFGKLYFRDILVQFSGDSYAKACSLSLPFIFFATCCNNPAK